MKTMSMVDAAVKVAGAPLVRFLRAGDNFTLHEQDLARMEKNGVLYKLPGARDNAITASAGAEKIGRREEQEEYVIDDNSKVVRIPALARRGVMVESPRLDIAQGYLARGRREPEALENFLFIVLWLSSLFAVACFISV